LALTQHLQADDGILLAMKGQIPAQELAELSEIYRVIPISVPGIDAERCLIELERTLHG
jgi:16S rRNA (guanine527-N7)-methyltransferase